MFQILRYSDKNTHLLLLSRQFALGILLPISGDANATEIQLTLMMVKINE